MTPLLHVKSDDRSTLALGLGARQQMEQTNWPLLMAAGVGMMLPMLLLFLSPAVAQTRISFMAGACHGRATLDEVIATATKRAAGFFKAPQR